ncbi:MULTISPECIES: Imm26 family immunity protein [unclassified Treponema]|uniref:Imm26 family immunity protein n=1 Tax=unclassified Treponema TaxID=2638727 RepID=UPI0020A3CF71|nr:MULTISPECIES: Imm26 family immunity protein [unclassified Treponema]UTC66575.1 hypothetical protein E4O06_11535 [Treponema sp. OMZ 789]UTC69308.1 hypothetical protein E4O01_11675 [Treponema sp. OMZ 790]UTC72022.1 hypothetical protein E4O02_11770 [Treponema sp. OMZ 791]
MNKQDNKNNFLMKIKQMKMEKDIKKNMRTYKTQKRYSTDGEVVAIPLFLTENPKAKLKKEDWNKQFAFARAINEVAGKTLIEVFNKTGNLNTPIDIIINSGILMKPFYTVWTPVLKKRWKSIYITPHYDKVTCSNYDNIELVLGSIDNLRVWKAKDNSETPITREELLNGDYQLMGIYTEVQVENKIIKKLSSISECL